jgi:hypothetical protein
MPGLIWVRDLMVGDVMVDRSFRVERLRPLGLWWAATWTWEPQKLRGAGQKLGCHLGALGRERIGVLRRS